MNKYTVKLYSSAVRDLDNIYSYITKVLQAPDTAANLINEIEIAIISLEELPERGAVRRTGAYADAGYRQLFVKNYVIVYRILEEKKEVHVITVRYIPSKF